MPIEADAAFAPITVDSPEALEILRHSAAHVMAEAVVALFGKDVQVAIGPATADGFYYDFDRAEPFTPDDLVRIEEKMQELVAPPLLLAGRPCLPPRRLSFLKRAVSPTRLSCCRILAAETVSLYRQGDFVDLCRGPHLPHAGWLKAVKVIKLAGAYWRGDEKRQMLQRIYGTAFFDPKDLKAYLHQIEEAKKRDHRKLGKELELFAVSDQVGPGLILWQPKGALLRKIIEDHWREEHYRNGYELLFTPHIARRDMWKTSGHLDFYGENMFSAMEIEEVSYQLKPMNCPFHIGIYNTRKRSYREFPLRWCELGTVYRFEKTGALHGLMRVRGFTQDDAHIFCRPDQLEEEIFNILDLNLHILKTFGFEHYEVYLSTRPEKSVGSDEHWEQATDRPEAGPGEKGSGL